MNNDCNSILFITYFDKNLPNFTNFVNEVWKSTIANNSTLKNFKLKIVYKNYPNLLKYLVYKMKVPFSFCKFSKCNNSYCKVCSFSVNYKYLINKFNLPILIPSNSNCQSKNCIYFLFCKKCEMYYVGETGRTISKRITEHLYKINYLKKIVNNKNISVIAKKILYNNFLDKCGESSLIYSHSLNNHDLNKDLRFQVFVNNFIFFRLRLETDLILLFKTMTPGGLNSIKSFDLKSLESYLNPPLS